MLNFTIEPKLRFKEILKKEFQHLPSERSVLNGAYKFTGFETDQELQVLALRSILELEREYKKRGKISIIIDEHIQEFMKLYVRLPHVLKDNVTQQLHDLFGNEILKYIERSNDSP